MWFARSPYVIFERLGNVIFVNSLFKTRKLKSNDYCELLYVRAYRATVCTFHTKLYYTVASPYTVAPIGHYQV